MKKLVIVGAGISGVYLSILLKQKLGSQVQVIVLEQNQSPLKKLLATGNGRCNLSNKDMTIERYQSDDLTKVNEIIKDFDMIKAMNELGLLCVYQGSLLYPKSEQALTVKNIFMNEAVNLGVLFMYEQEVLSVSQNHNQYVIQTNKQDYHCDYVIFAMGSEAGKLSGIKNTRYDILRKLHLDVVKPTPSLVQMKTKPVLKELKGVRVKGTFSLLEDGHRIHEEKGELLFTDYGISGIAIMQLSAYYKEGHHYMVSMDFFDDMCQKKLLEFIEQRMSKDYNHFYDGLLHNKVSLHFEKMNLKNAYDITKALKDYRLDIVGLQSYETAQVMKGGLSLNEVNQSLELKKYPHIYAVGEILNVTGMCGGYNIHFAMSCAKRVADAIERKFYDTNS